MEPLQLLRQDRSELVEGESAESEAETAAFTQVEQPHQHRVLVALHVKLTERVKGGSRMSRKIVVFADVGAVLAEQSVVLKSA